MLSLRVKSFTQPGKSHCKGRKKKLNRVKRETEYCFYLEWPFSGVGEDVPIKMFSPVKDHHTVIEITGVDFHHCCKSKEEGGRRCVWFRGKEGGKTTAVYLFATFDDSSDKLFFDESLFFLGNHDKGQDVVPALQISVDGSEVLDDVTGFMVNLFFILLCVKKALFFEKVGVLQSRHVFFVGDPLLPQALSVAVVPEAEHGVPRLPVWWLEVIRRGNSNQMGAPIKKDY